MCSKSYRVWWSLNALRLAPFTCIHTCSPIWPNHFVRSAVFAMVIVMYLLFSCVCVCIECIIVSVPILRFCLAFASLSPPHSPLYFHGFVQWAAQCNSTFAQKENKYTVFGWTTTAAATRTTLNGYTCSMHDTNRNEQHQQQAARKNKKSAGKAEKNRMDLRKQDEKAAWHFLFLLNDGKIFMTVVVTVLSIWTWSWTWILGTRFNWKLLAWPFIITLHLVLWLWHCVDWAKKGLRKKRGKKISRVSLFLRSSPIFNRESFTLNFSVHWLKTCLL